MSREIIIEKDNLCLMYFTSSNILFDLFAQKITSYNDNSCGRLTREQINSFYLSLFEMKDHYFQKIFYGEPATEEDIKEIKRIERGFYDLSVLEDIIITNSLKDGLTVVFSY